MNPETNLETVLPRIERLTYTKAEACAALGISPVTIWRLTRRGLLHPVPGLRHQLFPVQELRDFVAGKTGAV